MTISVRGVRRHFGAVRAVDGVDLEAHAGQVTALIGPNGSGKTTLLLVLAGLLRPDGGDVRICGFDPSVDSLETRARTGWMPDAFGTWDTLTCREVLTTFGTAYRLPRTTVQTRAEELLAAVHLTELADQHASVLSRGQKQRLGLARALVHDPDVLLLDEPASGLDPRSRVDMRVLLRSLAAQGKTVLISSHVLTELDELADAAVFLSKGKTVSVETIGSATAARSWRAQSLDLGLLTSWLTRVATPYSVEGDALPPDPFTRPPEGEASGAPGSVLLPLASDAVAAAFLRAAIEAGVPLTSLAPAGGALEQTYLALNEERR